MRERHGSFLQVKERERFWFTPRKIRGLRRVSEGLSLFTPANWREIQAVLRLKPVINSFLLVERGLTSLSTSKHSFSWMSSLSTPAQK